MSLISPIPVAIIHIDQVYYVCTCNTNGAPDTIIGTAVRHSTAIDIAADYYARKDH